MSNFSWENLTAGYRTNWNLSVPNGYVERKMGYNNRSSSKPPTGSEGTCSIDSTIRAFAIKSNSGLEPDYFLSYAKGKQFFINPIPIIVLNEKYFYDPFCINFRVIFFKHSVKSFKSGPVSISFINVLQKSHHEIHVSPFKCIVFLYWIFNLTFYLIHSYIQIFIVESWKQLLNIF